MNQKYSISKCAFVHRITGINKVWEKVLHLGVKKIIAKGTVINHSDLETFGYLQSGQVRLSSISDQGKERIVFYFDQGTIIQEINVYHYFNNKYTTEFFTTQDSVVYYFPKEFITNVDFARQYPDLIVNLIESLAFKAAAFFSQLSEKAVVDSTALLCRFIYQQYEEKKSLEYEFGYSQTEVSLILNIHRNTLCRIINTLRKEDVIGKCSKNCLEIKNLQRLIELAQI